MKAPHPYPGAPNASGSGPGAVVLTLAAVLFGSVSAYFALRADTSAPAPVEAAAAVAAPVHPSFAEFQEQELSQAQATEAPAAEAASSKGGAKSRAATGKSPTPAVATKTPAPAKAPGKAQAEPAPKATPKTAPKAAAESAPAPKTSAAASAPAASRDTSKTAPQKPSPVKSSGTLLGDLTVEELSKPEPPAFRRTVPNVGAGETSAAPRVSSAPAAPSAAVVELPSAAPKKDEAPAASSAPKSGTPLPRVGAPAAAPETVVPLKAAPLVPVPFDTKVVSSTPEKVWVQVEPTRTEIFEKGARVPGLGLFQGQDDKGNAKFGR